MSKNEKREKKTLSHSMEMSERKVKAMNEALRKADRSDLAEFLRKTRKWVNSPSPNDEKILA